MPTAYVAVGVLVAVIVLVAIISFLRGTTTETILTGIEMRFLSLLRSAIIWSAGFSLVAAIVLAGLGLLSLLAPSVNTNDFTLGAFGLFGAAAFLNAALVSFGWFVSSMLVFIFVAIELHLRPDYGPADQP